MVSPTLCSRSGYVVGLDYQDPRIDPHHVFQSFKPACAAAFPARGRKDDSLWCKSLPYGGWLTMPKLAGKGWMILGDSASMLNSQRLKGIHLAIKSGMLAAETAFESMLVGDNSSVALGAYQSRVEGSWIKEELYPVRNFHQGFEHGLLPGLVHSGVQQVLGGRNLGADFKNRAGYLNMRHLDAIGRSTYGREATLGPAKSDGKLTFDKLTDVYHSGTRHDDDHRFTWLSAIRIFATIVVSRNSATRASISARRQCTKWWMLRSTSTSPIVFIARRATSWIPTRSSPGCRPKVVAGRIMTACR